MNSAKRYQAAQARREWANVLDLAEAGESVLIERRGVFFRLQAAEPTPRRNQRQAPRVKLLDPAIEEGHWTWELREGDVVFKKRKALR